jgi:glycosyltransferase involved in cell wall biosynthesis
VIAASSAIVTAVIPTAARSRLVVRAVESALAQTLRDIEVVVVLDGPDRVTAKALEKIDDPRLRRVERPRRGGAGAARNSGVRAATTRWIAFLDDDDTWMPEKLAVQLAAALASGLAHPIVSGRVAVGDGSSGTRVWPRRLPRRGESLGDYMLVRRGLFWGEALVHTSTLLAERELLEDVPFREDIPRHEDLDWLLRAIRVPGAGVVFPPGESPVATWSVDSDRPRSSRAGDWRDSLAWARHARPLISRRAYASFALTLVAAHAARERSAEGLWRLPWEAFRHGRPGPRDLLLFAGIWLVPEAVRERLGRRRSARGG